MTRPSLGGQVTLTLVCLFKGEVTPYSFIGTAKAHDTSEDCLEEAALVMAAGKEILAF